MLCQVGVKCPDSAGGVPSPMTLKSEGPLPRGILYLATIEIPQTFAHVVENVGNVIGDVADCWLLRGWDRQRIELLRIVPQWKSGASYANQLTFIGTHELDWIVLRAIHAGRWQLQGR